MDRDRIDILLREYEICEQDNVSASANAWTVIGIFSSIGLGALGAVIYKTIEVNFNWQSLVLILVLGFMAIIVLHFLESWTKRATFLISSNNNRMREIEKILGMSKNMRIWELDGWEDMPLETRKRIVNNWEMLCSRCENREICEKTEEEKVQIECKKYKDNIAQRQLPDVPNRLRPPDTGRRVLSEFFKLLYIPWTLIILFSIGLLLYKLVEH